MQGSSYPPAWSSSRFGTVSDHASLPSDPYPAVSRGPLSPFEVELFVARVGSGRRAHAHPPDPTCRQVENSPRQRRLYEHCSPYPLGGFVRGTKPLTHPLHLLRPRSFGSPDGELREARFSLVAHIRTGIGSNIGISLSIAAEG